MNLSSTLQGKSDQSQLADNAQQKLLELQAKYEDADAFSLIKAMIEEEFAGQIAVSSSFGAEAAVLLDLISKVDQNTPILFIDTEKLFEETLQYKDDLQSALGLQNIIVVRPDPVHLQNVDPDGTLHQRDPDYCCHIRKVLPFEEALSPYAAWFSGRKRFQNSERSELQAIELDDDGRFKINPLYNWDYNAVMAHFKELKLPRHPLVSKGFLSIGCAPCTRAVKEGEDQRSGRWAGQSKNECGIHKTKTSAI